MANMTRRQITRIVGTSCLAAVFGLQGVTTAVAEISAVDRVTTAERAAPSPPEPPEPDTPPEPPEPDTPPSPDASQPKKPEELQKEVEDRIAKAPKEVKEEVKAVLTLMLDLIKDPNTTPEDRAAYTKIVEGITITLQTIEDPNTTPEDRAAYTRIVKAMTEAVRLSQDRPPSSGQEMQGLIPAGAAPVELPDLAAVSDVLVELQDPQTKPDDPKDRKKIQKIVEERCNAMKQVQDPKASRKERDAAKKKLDQQAESLKDSQYLELMKEIKRHKPRVACVETTENRTRQVGWPDGSLWGLSDPSCAAPVAEGARQEGSQWHALLECVLRDPFSTCEGHVPED